MRYPSPDGAGGDESQFSVGGRSGIRFSSVPTKYGNSVLESAASFVTGTEEEARGNQAAVTGDIRAPDAHETYVTDVKE